jgi:hypothetical protein
LLAVAKRGTAKDVAGMAAELVTGTDAPDDVLTELLGQLKASGQMSAKAVRAIDAALVVLTRSDRTNPVAVAATLPLPTNGQAVAVA